MGELMTPEDVATEIVENADISIQEIQDRVRSKNYPRLEEIQLFYDIQNVKISVYNMHMELQGVDFPLRDASDLADENRFQNLLSWISEYHPKN